LQVIASNAQSFPPAPAFPTLSDKWHDLYQSTMLELDDKKLSLRISEARHAIMDRSRGSFNRLFHGRATRFKRRTQCPEYA
jgi:hypothetical protein